MSKLGATVVFERDECKISKDSRLVGVGTMQGKLYVLKVVSEEYVNVANKITQIWNYGIVDLDI